MPKSSVNASLSSYDDIFSTEESCFTLISQSSQRNNSTSLSVLNAVRTFDCCV